MFHWYRSCLGTGCYSGVVVVCIDVVHSACKGPKNYSEIVESLLVDNVECCIMKEINYKLNLFYSMSANF